ncbi:hypothetical protein HK100_007820, partial [Physocladia obscura]
GMTGQTALNNYSSQIYLTIFSANSVAIINVANAVCGTLFTINSTFLVDRVGRIKLFVVGALGMAICCAGAAIVYDLAPDKTSFNLGVQLVTILFTFVFFFKPTWGATSWVYIAEIFPIVVRAQAVGIAVQSQNVANLIMGQIFPILFSAMQFNVFFLFMGINLLLGIVVCFFPETRGVALEEMDTLFDDVSDTDSTRGFKIGDDEMQLKELKD